MARRRLTAAMGVAFAAALTVFSCAAAQVAPAAQTGPALWSLSDEDTTIYLFGTIHALPPGTAWRTPEMQAAFSAADTLCVETDIETHAFDIAMFTMREGVFRGDERLSDYLDDEQVAELEAISAELGILYIGLDVMQPWNAMFTLATGFAIRAGLMDTEGVDTVLYGEAVAEGKSICEMETWQEHLSSVADLPIDVQIAVLTYRDPDDPDYETAAELIDAAVLEFPEMIDDWLAADISEMAGRPEEYGHPAFYESLITRRNAAWTDKIEVMLAEQPGVIFIAVGAAHLAGPDSVQSMLISRGYTVIGPDPLSPDPLSPDDAQASKPRTPEMAD